MSIFQYLSDVIINYFFVFCRVHLATTVNPVCTYCLLFICLVIRTTELNVKHVIMMMGLY